MIEYTKTGLIHRLGVQEAVQAKRPVGPKPKVGIRILEKTRIGKRYTTSEIAGIIGRTTKDLTRNLMVLVRRGQFERNQIGRTSSWRRIG